MKTGYRVVIGLVLINVIIFTMFGIIAVIPVYVWYFFPTLLSSLLTGILGIGAIVYWIFEG